MRVRGPFTVESLSPHRVLSTVEEKRDGTVNEQDAPRSQARISSATMILDNLKKAGVQNTVKNERLKFDRLEPLRRRVDPRRRRIHRGGRQDRRVAVCIGPEHGTVGPELVKEAAKEAVQGVGFDLLIVCGFAFDPHVAEEAKRYGKLTVLPARMNPDLAMGDELLKKTGAGNLFMVFGEPDVEIKKQKDGADSIGRDQGRGRVRPDHRADSQQPRTDDIACWFIDTELQRRELLRAPRLLHRRRRALRQAETRAPGRHRRSRLVSPLLAP